MIILDEWYLNNLELIVLHISEFFIHLIHRP